jgi:hypothetical protein
VPGLQEYRWIYFCFICHRLSLLWGQFKGSPDSIKVGRE